MVRLLCYDDDEQLHNFRRCSLVWSGIHPHASRIHDGSFWLIGQHSTVGFWTDNWLGYRLVDRLGMPEELRPKLTTSVGDYFVDGTWYFTISFFTCHLEIVLDILRTPVQVVH